MSKTSLDMEIEQALRSGTIPWIIIDIARTAIADAAFDGLDGEEGVEPEWVIDQLFTQYWADYQRMTPDEQIKSVRDEQTRSVADFQALEAERDSQGS